MSTLRPVKLSQGVEWGMHCVALVALAPAGSPVRREVLATHYGLPEAYLGKHLQALTRSGVLRAVPGPKGGYLLARPATEITALEVLEAVEGTARPFLCQEIRKRGTGAMTDEQCTGPCAIDRLMGRAHEAWRAELREVTVADLVDEMPGWLRERNAAAVSP